MVTRVGVLLVHGIGETKKFEIIEEVARNITISLKADTSLTVRIIINSSDSGARGSSQQTWIADEEEPVIIEVRDGRGQVTEIAFREAWWADIGKSDSLQTQVAFWVWGLSLWSRKQFIKSKFGTSDEMIPPTNVNSQNPQITIGGRLKFFVVSWILLLIMPMLSLLSVLLRQILGFALRPDILVQYLGDIKHYQQEQPARTKAFEDIDEPPRVGVRRIIKELVKMSLQNYDRWYILAHSLGTVAAFNGLMETQAALPNYLNESLWGKWQKYSSKKATVELTDEQVQEMFPSRPAWLRNEDIVDRADLFANLRGLLTYGSPLSKFAVVWPAIVTINKNNSVFSPSFEWINVYDPTDPVGGETEFFNLKDWGGSQPVEIAYKAEGVHLLSHVEYMTYSSRRQTPLVKQVSTWLLEGKVFQPAHKKSWGWPDENQKKFYVGMRYGIWLILGWLIPWILGLFINWQLPESMKKIITQNTNLDILNPLLYITGSGVIVFIMGGALRLFTNKSSKQ
jgi:hypothetical protein